MKFFWELATDCFTATMNFIWAMATDWPTGTIVTIIACVTVLGLLGCYLDNLLAAKRHRRSIQRLDGKDRYDKYGN